MLQTPRRSHAKLALLGGTEAPKTPFASHASLGPPPQRLVLPTVQGAKEVGMQTSLVPNALGVLLIPFQLEVRRIARDAKTMSDRLRCPKDAFRAFQDCNSNQAATIAYHALQDSNEPTPKNLALRASKDLYRPTPAALTASLAKAARTQATMLENVSYVPAARTARLLRLRRKTARKCPSTALKAPRRPSSRLLARTPTHSDHPFTYASEVTTAPMASRALAPTIRLENQKA